MAARRRQGRLLGPRGAEVPVDAPNVLQPFDRPGGTSLAVVTLVLVNNNRLKIQLCTCQDRN